MDYTLICTYCNHRWTEFFLNPRSLSQASCDICKDTNLKIREAKTEKVDYYVGCPPFESKKIEQKKEESIELLNNMPVPAKSELDPYELFALMSKSELDPYELFALIYPEKTW